MPKILVLGNPNKNNLFVWIFERLVVPLASPKVLTLGKLQINLTFGLILSRLNK